MNGRGRPRAASESAPTTATTKRIVTGCPDDNEVYVGGEWIRREVRDRRCHPDQLSEWVQEGIRRHDERRKRARAWMADPANAEAVAIIRAMLDGRRIP
jgi:hypothetical protein